MKLIGITLRHFHPASIRGNDDKVIAETSHEIDQYRHCGEVVDRTIEKALNLTRVQIDRDKALCSGGLEHVRDQLRRDRFATFGLSVLTRIAIERGDGGDSFRRSPLGSIDHDELFHDRVVHGHLPGTDMGLNNEHVSTAN